MSAALREIGFWSGPWAASGWPSVDQFVDPDWDPEDREFIAFYLESGLVARVYMGYSTCRVCGKSDNGDSELTDGTWVWPSGLAHYVREHAVRLPAEFTQHAIAVTEQLENRERDEAWWRTAVPDW